MQTSIIPTFNNKCSVSEAHGSTYCTLQWRRNQLLVMSSGIVKQPYMPLLDTYESLRECLEHSSVRLVRIDPKLGEEKVRLWADAATSASKPIYLRISAGQKQPKPNSYLLWWLKRLSEWMIASVVLLIVSPLMLLLALLMKIDAKAPLFERSWYVGERGRLFQSITYRTVSVNPKIDSKALESKETIKEKMTLLGRWMAKYGLNNLPQLFNVLRGEMGLFGSRCWTLEDAVKLTPEAQKQLNNLPGIMSSWEVEAEESNILHLDSQIS
ncbi:MAG: heterocyst development glycosyltransferase HepC [Cyanobacteria bacterium P01_D01_bin.116]